MTIPVLREFWIKGRNRSVRAESKRKASFPSKHDDEVTNNTEGWVINIEEKLNQVSSFKKEDSWLDHCIFRVPRNLRVLEPKAYIPQLVSIGPYHRGKARLKEMEKHKWRLLQHVLERTGLQVKLLLEAMSELEETARRCYANQFEYMDSGEFVEMMLLDACFVLELLNASINGLIYCGYSWGDPIFSSRGVLPCIQRDMLMLENQLPLFVLDRLFALTCDPNQTESVSQLALQFFDSIIPECRNLHHGLTSSTYRGLHLLHVVRQCLLPSSKATFQREDAKEHQPQLVGHCVTMLRDSGVKFQKKNSGKFMDIEFKKGVLHIPPLVIHDSTKSIFLNLMAFEQCYSHCSNHVTSYIRFMDGIINSSRDVGYLLDKGIIDHGLGSEEEVAFLFNTLCKDIAFDINDCYLSSVYADVNRYFDRKWHWWEASLMHQYLSNPWAILSLLAAILLLVFTLTQTFYTVFSYYKIK
ncbi:hypothetical protein HHK36_012255 [Tetracentron sinense]|uniref:Uncharacterized protein n=1 Tax=Tetracentron sinense TaxID=13715 RepID=A0A834Z8Z4_TETSI|nr:hypothetical protein HHK36_012255 [Tetracentron sinense]